MQRSVHKNVPRLFLREHREAAGLSVRRMADRLGVARESVYRIEASQSRARRNQLAYALALGLNDPSVLWRRPDTAHDPDRAVANLIEVLWRHERMK